MNTSQSNTDSSAAKLGQAIREARRRQGLTISELAEKIGRSREWLNRIELGYSDNGDIKPPSPSDIGVLIGFLGSDLGVSPEKLMALGAQAEAEFNTWRRNARRPRKTAGKLTQTEIIIGENQVIQAIIDVIKEQHSDAIIRNTGIKSLNSYLEVTSQWKQYRHALADFLRDNANGLFKRVEYVASSHHLTLAKEADQELAGDRNLEDIHNAKLKFLRNNPLQLHILIGQREAILALPQSSGQAGSSMAILVRDKLFVEALRVWYDEVLWDDNGSSQMVRFSEFEESFDEIKNMYGYK